MGAVKELHRRHGCPGEEMGANRDADRIVSDTTDGSLSIKEHDRKGVIPMELTMPILRESEYRIPYSDRNRLRVELRYHETSVHIPFYSSRDV